MLAYSFSFFYVCEYVNYSPPDPHQNVCSWLLDESNVKNLVLLSAVPQAGLRRIRIHWLLDAITLEHR